MDHQHQHQHIPDDHSQSIAAPSYAFYPQADQDTSYALAYPQHMSPYQVVQHPGTQTRQLSTAEMHQQGIQFHNLGLMAPHQYPPPVYTGSPQHVSLPLSTSPPPQSPNMYDPLSPPISGSDTSADGIYTHSRNSSTTGSPASSRGNSLVHRSSIRYNPTPSPTSSSSGRRGRGRSLHDSDEDDNMGVAYVENLAYSRKEATRRQRIEAEQRRRDELRDGYAKLKDVLPVSNQKSSKVSLLERATNHIVALEKANHDMQARIAALEQEVLRLRGLNEKISLGVDTPPPSQSLHSTDARPISPPPDGPLPHSLASVKGQEPPREDSSPSASECDF